MAHGLMRFFGSTAQSPPGTALVTQDQRGLAVANTSTRAFGLQASTHGQTAASATQPCELYATVLTARCYQRRTMAPTAALGERMQPATAANDVSAHLLFGSDAAADLVTLVGWSMITRGGPEMATRVWREGSGSDAMPIGYRIVAEHSVMVERDVLRDLRTRPRARLFCCTTTMGSNQQVKTQTNLVIASDASRAMAAASFTPPTGFGVASRGALMLPQGYYHSVLDSPPLPTVSPPAGPRLSSSDRGLLPRR